MKSKGELLVHSLETSEQQMLGKFLQFYFLLENLETVHMRKQNCQRKQLSTLYGKVQDTFPWP